MAEPKQDVLHTMKREQCYLCVMTLVDNPPTGTPPAADLRRAHKQFLADLEIQGRLFGAGKLENNKEKEKTVILRIGQGDMPCHGRAERVFDSGA